MQVDLLAQSAESTDKVKQRRGLEMFITLKFHFQSLQFMFSKVEISCIIKHAISHLRTVHLAYLNCVLNSELSNQYFALKLEL